MYPTVERAVKKRGKEERSRILRTNGCMVDVYGPYVELVVLVSDNK